MSSTGNSYDYETEEGDEKLSATQLTWKQKYRRAKRTINAMQKTINKLQKQAAEHKEAERLLYETIRKQGT
jgi:hypothetical protein